MPRCLVGNNVTAHPPSPCPTGRPARRTGSCTRARRAACGRSTAGTWPRAHGARSPTTRSASSAGPSRWTAPTSCGGRTRRATSRVGGSRRRSRAATPGRTSTGSRSGGTKGSRRRPESWPHPSAIATGSRCTSRSTEDRRRRRFRSTDWLRVSGPDDAGFNRGGLSADGSLLCLQHCEGGDMLHPALRVIDPRTGGVVADLRDEGKSLSTAAWSPVAGDGRLAVIHERGGEEATAIWEPATGTWTDVQTDLHGEVAALDWWPDGSALLLANLVEGRHRLYRYDLVTGRSHADRASGGTDLRRTRPARRHGVVPLGQRRQRAARPERSRRRGAAHRGRTRGRAAARTSRSGSTTSTDSRFTASTRPRRARGRSRSSSGPTAGPRGWKRIAGAPRSRPTSTPGSSWR